MLATTSSSFVTPEVAHMFGSDPELRARLMADPVSTLELLGVDTAELSVPREIVLPTASDLEGVQLQDAEIGAGSIVWQGFILD